MYKYRLYGIEQRPALMRRSKKPLSELVIETVASRKGVPIDGLEPLLEVIDPDALDVLFAPLPDGTPRSDATTSVIRPPILPTDRGPPLA